MVPGDFCSSPLLDPGPLEDRSLLLWGEMMLLELEAEDIFTVLADLQEVI